LIHAAPFGTVAAMTEETDMLARNGLDPQEALVCTMVLVAAASGGISDREIGVMSGLVQTLPAFRDFSPTRLEVATTAAIDLLREDEGLAHAAEMIRNALPPRLRETAYALACDVAAANKFVDQDSLRMLAFVREELHLDGLMAAAIERGARARHQQI
jgi:tellurite resistance protein